MKAPPSPLPFRFHADCVSDLSRAVQPAWARFMDSGPLSARCSGQVFPWSASLGWPLPAVTATAQKPNIMRIANRARIDGGFTIPQLRERMGIEKRDACYKYIQDRGGRQTFYHVKLPGLCTVRYGCPRKWAFLQPRSLICRLV